MANKLQKHAINAPYNRDILISAGAGSGKTSTVADRVFHLVAELPKDKRIKPSELLVLTFTNNAAHEMKERIVGIFEDKAYELEKLNPTDTRIVELRQLGKEMQSAHIQTFDSFSAYLVGKYATKLGVSDQLAIANKTAIDTKKYELLDIILDEYYTKQSSRLLKTLVKFNTKDDNNTKKVLLDLDKRLSGMTKENKDNFIQRMKNDFFTDKTYFEFIKLLCNDSKDSIIKALDEMRYIEEHGAILCVDTKSLDDGDKKIAYLNQLNGLLKVKNNYCFDHNSDYKINQTNLENPKEIDINQNHIIPLYQELARIVNILNKEDDEKYGEFLFSASTFAKRYEESLKGNKYSFSLLLKEEFKCIKKMLDKTFVFTPGWLEVENGEDYLLKDKEKFLSFKEDILLYLEIIEELNKRMKDYKRQSNIFTFSDISSMALSLFTDKKYEDIANEIRDRFSYIIIDEYQDTSDFQETFIDALCQTKTSGSRAHIFCVGDAKQSIYAFRNSKVELFRKRRDLYNNGNQDEQEVIDMNINYRSGPGVLDDINYIFKYYMTLEHGEIDYLDDAEQLKYDYESDIYRTKEISYDGFGIHRLISTSYEETPHKNKACDEKISEEENPARWEAVAIVKDIINKINNHYQVFPKGKNSKPRDCELSDFVILSRTKNRCFDLYQEVFNKYRVPLNNNISTDLKEVDAIIVLQSLISLLVYKLNLKTDIDIKHIYASIARSYIYQQSDDQIYQAISCKPTPEDNEGLRIINQSQIIKDIDDFIKENQNKSFSEIFLHLIKDFNIVKKLHLIGDVDSNISKIESLYQTILAQQQAGYGLTEFLILLISSDKFQLKLESESTLQIENAVDLMTIHASKGLQNKIVYLPVSFNNFSSGNNMDKADYLFSNEFGIFMPYYDYEEDREISYKNGPYAFIESKMNKDADISEHVRLVYVALTRAENAIYIVGHDNKKKENLYEMLNSVPHYEKLNRSYVNDLLKAGMIDEKEIDDYDELLKLHFDIVKPSFSLEDFQSEAEYKQYLFLLEERFKAISEEIVNNQLDSIIGLIHVGHSSKLDNLSEEEKVRLFAFHKFKNTEAKTINDLIELIHNTKEDESYDEEDSGDDTLNESLDSFIYPSAREEWQELLNQFVEDIRTYNKESRVIRILSYAKQSKDATKKYYHRLFSGPFAFTFNKYTWLTQTCYSNESFTNQGEYIYKDKVQYINPNEKVVWEGGEIPIKDTLKKDNTQIDFADRISLRASKQTTIEEEGSIDQSIFEFGTRLHRYMELVDLVSKDTSFIKNEKERYLITRAIKNPLLTDLSNAEIYKEYGYYDDLLSTTGFIDLLVIKNGTYYIIDYKTKHIDDEAYEDQLHAYQRNIQKIFGVDKKNIKLFLLSIIDGAAKEIDTD